MNLIKCVDCKYHDVWTENEIVLGYVCNNPIEKQKPGLLYGRYFGIVNTCPKWCEKRTEDNK